jgi:hypothetical protein
MEEGEGYVKGVTATLPIDDRPENMMVIRSFPRNLLHVLTGHADRDESYHGTRICVRRRGSGLLTFFSAWVMEGGRAEGRRDAGRLEVVFGFCVAAGCQ